MKKLLLASTALVGAAMLAAPAMAGTPSVKDDFSVSIGGSLRFSVFWWDQDADNFDRGYGFASGDSEISFQARGTTENGLAYGFDIEVQTQTDDAGGNSDETWMFIDGGDAWGRIELGDQDGAADRLMVDGEDATDAGRGIAGGAGDIPIVKGSQRAGSNMAGASLAFSGDASKIIYFTPRFAGVQVGASWTPDTGSNGKLDSKDNAADNENVYSIGVNYSNEFNGVGITVAGVYIGGDNEDTDIEEPEIWGVGINVRYAGFEFGTGYADRNETGITVTNAANGEDAGRWWNVGLNYKTGPWTVGAGFFTAEGDYVNTVTTGDFESKVFQFGFDYTVAPGWKIESGLQFVELDNYNDTGADNDATVFTFSSTMSF